MDVADTMRHARKVITASPSDTLAVINVPIEHIGDNVKHLFGCAHCGHQWKGTFGGGNYMLCPKCMGEMLVRPTFEAKEINHDAHRRS